MTAKLFEVALGISDPWHIAGVDFDETTQFLAILVDFTVGSRFPHSDAEGLNGAYGIVAKRYRHLNFFQHECHLEVCVLRIRLPDGRVALIEPPWGGQALGVYPPVRGLVLVQCRQMTSAAVARMVGESWYRVATIMEHRVELTLDEADFSKVLAIDETSRVRGYDSITLTADAEKRVVLAVTEPDAQAIHCAVSEIKHGGGPEAITPVSLDMSPAFIKVVEESLPHAQITFEKFHMIAHASFAVDKARHMEQKNDPHLRGMRWSLLKDCTRLKPEQRRRSGSFVEPTHHQAYRACLGVPGRLARDSKPQANQSGARHAKPMVYERDAL